MRYNILAIVTMTYIQRVLTRIPHTRRKSLDKKKSSIVNPQTRYVSPRPRPETYTRRIVQTFAHVRSLYSLYTHTYIYIYIFRIHLSLFILCVCIQIRKLKDKISEKEGVPSDQIRLVIKGRSLTVDDTIKSLKLKNGSTVTMILALWRAVPSGDFFLH